MEKLKKIKNIPDFNFGDSVNDLFVVRFKKPPQITKTNNYWFELKLQDAKGDAMLKYWGGPDREKVEKLYNSIENDCIILVTGRAKKSSFSKNIEFSVNEGS